MAHLFSFCVSAQQQQQQRPTELNQDHIDVFTIAQVGRGCVTVNDVMQHLHWTKEKAERTLDFLLQEEMAQRDESQSFYWLPCCGDQM